MSLIKKYIVCSFLCVLFFFFLSCSSNNDGEETCRLTSVKAETLYYEQVPAIVLANPNFSGKIQFEYNDNGQIVKMLGGPISYNFGDDEVFFTDDLVNEVSYQGNIITAQNKYKYEMPASVIDYKVQSGKLITRTVKSYNNDIQETVNYQYEYGSNQIIEKKENTIFRIFYFEDDNLVKVEEIHHDYLIGEIVGKTEIILSNYDSHENLLQGKYFVNGAFFNAFSKNNFRNFERKHYTYIGDQYVESGNSYGFNFTTNVGQNGLVDLFETTCN